MPSRNILKLDVAGAYYHIYSRGVNKQVIFTDDADYAFFLSLLKRYLSPETTSSKKGVVYPNYYSGIVLHSFCLMPNHIHLLIHQKNKGVMQQLMRSLMTSYSSYFNRKHERRGPLFESRYKASHIDSDSYLQHISRYIHLNPAKWREYPYSSQKYFLGNSQAEWLKPQKILDIFSSRQEYEKFLEDYEGQKEILDDLKHQLADTPY